MSENTFLYDYKNFYYIKKEFKAENFLGVCGTSLRDGDTESSVPTFIDDQNYYCKPKLRSQEDIAIEGPEILYKYNLDGFRSKHFQEFNKNNTNILFSGCSVTCGEGMPEEYIWTNILTDKIKEVWQDKVIDSYNVSDPGGNIWQIFHNIKTFIIKYGKPNYICITYPGFERTMKYEEDGLQFTKVTTAAPDTQSYKASKATRHFMDSYIIEESMLLAAEFINSLDLLCKILDIKLLWTTWHGDYFKFCENLESDNYLPLDFRLQGLLDNQDDLINHPYYNLSRDGHHNGIQYHSQIAQNFFNSLTGVDPVKYD